MSNEKSNNNSEPLDETTFALQKEISQKAKDIVLLCCRVNAGTLPSLEVKQRLREIQKQVFAEHKLMLDQNSLAHILQIPVSQAEEEMFNILMQSHDNVHRTPPGKEIVSRNGVAHQDVAYLPIPGVQVINARHLQVDMLHLKIADKDLQEGRPSVTPDLPIEVEYNIDKKTFRLRDGYHRYLEKRGGSLAAALAQSKAGEFPDFAVNLSLAKMVRKGAFGEFEAPLTEDETQKYVTQLLGKRERLARAKAQGFDTATVWYHGSIPAIGEVGSDIQAFEHEKIGNNYWQDQQGFFFINDPGSASRYASHNSIGTSVPGGSVYPVYLAAERVFVVNDAVAKKNGWALPSRDDVISVWDNHHADILLKAGDADAIEIVDTSSRQSMRVMFNPANIRSVHASFLPEHRERHQLLGHDYTPALPYIKPRKPLPENLLPIAKAFEYVLRESVADRDVQLAKKLLHVVEGQVWSKEDKIAVLNAVQDRDTLKLPAEERAKAITLAIQDSLFHYGGSVSLTQSVELEHAESRPRPR